jgi:hypothetical protein
MSGVNTQKEITEKELAAINAENTAAETAAKEKGGVNEENIEPVRGPAVTGPLSLDVLTAEERKAELKKEKANREAANTNFAKPIAQTNKNAFTEKRRKLLEAQEKAKLKGKAPLPTTPVVVNKKVKKFNQYKKLTSKEQDELKAKRKILDYSAVEKAEAAQAELYETARRNLNVLRAKKAAANLSLANSKHNSTDEIKRLNQTIQKLEVEIPKYKQSLEEAEAKLETANKELQPFKDKIKEQEAKKADTEKRMTEKEANVAQLTTELAKLAEPPTTPSKMKAKIKKEEELTEAKRILEEIKPTLQTIKQTIATEQKHIDELYTKHPELSGLTSRVNKFKELLSQNEPLLATSKERIQQLTEQQAKNLAKEEELRKNSKVFDEQIKNAEETIVEYEKLQGRLTENVADAVKEYGNVKGAIEKAAMTKKNVHEELEQLKKGQPSVDTSEFDEKSIDELEALIEAKKAEIQTKEGEKQVAKKAYRDLLTNNDAKETDLTAKKQLAEEIESILSKLYKERDILVSARLKKAQEVGAKVMAEHEASIAEMEVAAKARKALQNTPEYAEASKEVDKNEAATAAAEAKAATASAEAKAAEEKAALEAKAAAEAKAATEAKAAEEKAAAEAKAAEEKAAEEKAAEEKAAEAKAAEEKAAEEKAAEEKAAAEAKAAAPAPEEPPTEKANASAPATEETNATAPATEEATAANTTTTDPVNETIQALKEIEEGTDSFPALVPTETPKTKFDEFLQTFYKHSQESKANKDFEIYAKVYNYFFALKKLLDSGKTTDETLQAFFTSPADKEPIQLSRYVTSELQDKINKEYTSKYISLIPFEHFLLNPIEHKEDSTGTFVYIDEAPSAPDIIKTLATEMIPVDTGHDQTGGGEAPDTTDTVNTLLHDLIKSTKDTPETKFQHLMANEYKKIESSDEDHKYSRVEFYVKLFIYLYAVKKLLDSGEITNDTLTGFFTDSGDTTLVDLQTYLTPELKKEIEEKLKEDRSYLPLIPLAHHSILPYISTTSDHNLHTYQESLGDYLHIIDNIEKVDITK